MSATKARKCKCGSEEFSRDISTSGDIVCTLCGLVFQENPIVLEVQFGELSSGAAMVQGSMVGSDQARAPIGGRQNAMESREQTIMNGKRKIRRIAQALNIADHVSESAGVWFQLALTQNFVQGRRLQNVLASCLYLACRKEKTHHMLIDFSAVLQISVYLLGATFLKMVKALEVTKLPLADPSLFIQHFAERLQFGNKTTAVVRCAVDLADRMASDWIDQGRRPAGIAGACLLIAARLNGFNRTHAEIVAVSHVALETVQRRMNEFGGTSSGKQTLAAFRNKERPLVTQDPPSFKRNRERETELKHRLQRRKTALDRIQEYLSTEDGESEEGRLENASEDVEHDSENGEQLEAGTPLFVLEETPEPEGPASESLQSPAEHAIDPSASRATRNRMIRHAREEQEKEQLLRTLFSGCQMLKETLKMELDRIMKRKLKLDQDATYHNPAEEKHLADLEAQIQENWPRNLVSGHRTTKDILDSVHDGPVCSDDEDDEVNDIMLTEEEFLVKENIWMGINADFVKAQEAKRLKQEADEATGNTLGTTVKKKRRRKNDDDEESIRKVLQSEGVVNDAAELAGTMLQKKSFSKKINYQILDSMFQPGE